MPFNQTAQISRAIVAVAGKPFRLADYFSGLLGFAQNVDEAFRAFDTDPASKANLDQNGLFLEISARTGPREVTSESIFFLDGEVYATVVIR